MAVKKITWRWLMNSFAVIVAIVVIVECAFAYGISKYYYNMVRQTLRVQADVVGTTVQQYYTESQSSGKQFSGQVRDYVAAFPARERMELMLLTPSGKIALTSSGFMPDDAGNLDDYSNALLYQEGEHIFETGGQRVMAVSYLVSIPDDVLDLSAVRLVVSLERIDRQITFWIICMIALGVAVLALVLFSSSYFISSIVNPIGEVGETARRIAEGDFGARLEKRSNDEIGDLCETINYMAAKLDETERMKNDFISSVSHELRTPLTAIQGWGETLLADDGQDSQLLQRGMGVIIGETARLSQMVEELLDFSRMQSGRMNMVMNRVDALAELSDVILMYTERAKREDKKLLYRDDDLIVPVMGDKNRLRQVFVNIIDNAIKYSDPGDTVQVFAGVDADTLIITVADTGIGISPEDLPRVKTKFFKANSTRRASGIGLAVADEIIHRHGGTISLDSVYEKGTTVTITLPIHRVQDNA